MMIDEHPVNKFTAAFVRDYRGTMVNLAFYQRDSPQFPLGPSKLHQSPGEAAAEEFSFCALPKFKADKAFEGCTVGSE